MHKHLKLVNFLETNIEETKQETNSSHTVPGFLYPLTTSWNPISTSLQRNSTLVHIIHTHSELRKEPDMSYHITQAIQEYILLK